MPGLRQAASHLAVDPTRQPFIAMKPVEARQPEESSAGLNNGSSVKEGAVKGPQPLQDGLGAHDSNAVEKAVEGLDHGALQSPQLKALLDSLAATQKRFDELMDVFKRVSAENEKLRLNPAAAAVNGAYSGTADKANGSGSSALFGNNLNSGLFGQFGKPLGILGSGIALSAAIVGTLFLGGLIF